MAIQITNRQIITLDSLDGKLMELNNSLTQQSIQMTDQNLQTQKVIHQLRIQNMYKANENHFIIDDNIFENDEID